MPGLLQLLLLAALLRVNCDSWVSFHAARSCCGSAGSRGVNAVLTGKVKVVLERAPGFAEEAARAGVEPRALLAAVAALSLPEKFVLVDLAIQANAPAGA
jgi:hypothetical protein